MGNPHSALRGITVVGIPVVADEAAGERIGSDHHVTARARSINLALVHPDETARDDKLAAVLAILVRDRCRRRDRTRCGRMRDDGIRLVLADEPTEADVYPGTTDRPGSVGVRNSHRGIRSAILDRLPVGADETTG